MNEKVSENSKNFDRISKIIGNVLATIAIAILFWVGNTLIELKDRTASLDAEIRIQSERVIMIEANMERATADRYTTTDASKDLDLIRQQLERLDERLSRLEFRSDDGYR